MSRPAQQTIAREVGLAGVGVHSGQEAALTFRPAEPGSGVRFRRVDLEGCPEIPATIDNVVATELGTTVGIGDAKVLTIEHVMAALAGLRIDNVLVDIDGPELPIRDGSFQDYCVALEEAGAVEQDEEAEVLKLSGVVEASGGKGASYVATAGPGGLRISATIDFENPTIGRSYGSFDLDPASFRKDVAPARTFGFMADADALHARGLALGASLENAIVIDDDGVMNDELRFDDEFLRHKVGDVLGDLALLGTRLDGHIVQGHVDGTGHLIESTKDGEYWLLDFRIPDDVHALTIGHGSITLNGVSLTVSELLPQSGVRIGVIPHTHAHTNLGALEPAAPVNVEGDMLGKYVARILGRSDDA